MPKMYDELAVVPVSDKEIAPLPSNVADPVAPTGVEVL
jgi:hypothetical protein